MKCTRFIFACLALGLIAPTNGFALGVMGQVEVKLDGFKGWHQTRDQDLELRFGGLVTTTAKKGVFKFRDLGLMGRRYVGQGVVLIDNDEENYVRFLVGHSRVMLPITWRGEIRGDWLVLHRIECSLLADGTGGCQAIVGDLMSHEVKLRRMLQLPVNQVVTPVRPKAAEPAKPAGGTATVRTIPANPQPNPAQKPAPTQPAVAEPWGDQFEDFNPNQPPQQKKPAEDPDLELVEPM